MGDEVEGGWGGFLLNVHSVKEFSVTLGGQNHSAAPCEHTVKKDFSVIGSQGGVFSLNVNLL